MEKQIVNPPELFDSRQFGFSQIAVTSGGKMIHMSGQVGWDENRQIVGAGDLKAQAWQAFKNVEIALNTVGATLADIVSMRIYIVHDVMDENSAVSEALRHFFPTENPPVSTWIGVPSLANKDFLIEIEPIAMI